MNTGMSFAENEEKSDPPAGFGEDLYSIVNLML